jgi:hypothetical protein
MTNLDWNKTKRYPHCPLNIKDEAAFLNNDSAANWLKKNDSKKKGRFRKRKRANYARNGFSTHKGKLARKTVVVGKNGDPCPRCGCSTEIRQHKQVGAEQLRQPFYYSRWYYCANANCRTSMIMPEKFKVCPSAPHNITGLRAELRP